MQRKNFPLGEGGWGEEGSDEGSEEKSCENFLSILNFSREKSVLTKVVPYDAKSLKNIIFFYFDTLPYGQILVVSKVMVSTA